MSEDKDIKNTETSTPKENEKGMTIPKINNPLQDSFRGIEMYQKQMENIQAKLEQIRNPEAIKAVISLHEKLRNSCNLLSTVNSENRQKLFQNYSKIQQQVNKVLSAPQVSIARINAFEKMGNALYNAALSDSVTDYQKNIQEALDAEKEFSKSASDSQDENDSDIAKETITKISENVTDANLSERKTIVVDLLKSILDQNIGQRLTAIETLLRNFLRKFEIIALKNEKSSAKTACWSKWLASIAIIISTAGIIMQTVFSCRAEKNDKTGELIEVVKKSHPWHEQQISVEDAKNISATFHAINGALQKNVQLEKDNIQFRQETARLEVNLKKAQDTLSGLEKKYNAATAGFALEKQKLYAEIAALKKQIEELEIALRKNFLSLGKEQEKRK